MPAVCSKSVRRKTASLHPNRAATPGRCQTGSMAAFTTSMAPPSRRIFPSTWMRPASIAATSSGRWMRARVIAMVGRMS